ncbi:MAG TPA: DUF6463 family protein [Rubrobacter sp.]|nr:DUF6463 family protein [Rubrobacter sp.]
MTRLPRPTSGAALVVIGILHTSIGLLEYRAVLREMVRDGMIDTVEGDAEREAAFWFLTCGVSLVSMGWSFRWARQQTGTLPSFVGPALLGIATAGVTLMPRSGFWADFVPAILAYGERDQQGG